MDKCMLHLTSKKFWFSSNKYKYIAEIVELSIVSFLFSFLFYKYSVLIYIFEHIGLLQGKCQNFYGLERL